jgi:hypothetical protein
VICSDKTNLLYSTFDLFKRVGIESKEIKYYLGGSDGAVNTPAYFNDIYYVAEPTITAPPDVFKVSISNGGVVPDSAVVMGPDKILNGIFDPYKDASKDNWENGFAKLMTVDELSAREYIRTQTLVKCKVHEKSLNRSDLT